MAAVSDEKKSNKKKLSHEELLVKFQELLDSDIETQQEFFLKSFIFELGDSWKDIPNLVKEFRKALRDSDEGKDDLNPIMAADFLQKKGKERTAIERKAEVADIDLNNDNRIGWLEMALLLYKIMILESYYKRLETAPEEDLSSGGIGITGVGPKLLEELFTLPMGLNPEIEAALEEFTAQMKAREAKMSKLHEAASKGGVKGLAAKNEIAQIESQDNTALNRLEITLNAAKRRAAKESGTEALKKKQEAEAAAKKAAADASKAKLKARAALWENNS
jgi:F actin bundling C terminal